MATAAALGAAQMVAPEVELDIRDSGMVRALYAELPDFLILIL
jgi:hypothetical protein